MIGREKARDVLVLVQESAVIAEAIGKIVFGKILQSGHLHEVFTCRIGCVPSVTRDGQLRATLEEVRRLSVQTRDGGGSPIAECAAVLYDKRADECIKEARVVHNSGGEFVTVVTGQLEHDQLSLHVAPPFDPPCGAALIGLLSWLEGMCSF
jgi:hypothetical protein